MTEHPVLDELAAQEARLVFDRFDDDTAWAFGVALRDAARAAGSPVAISIRRNGQRLFHAALPGATADNDGWLERKSAVVDRYGHSSLYVGEEFRAAGKTFEDSSRLDPAATPPTVAPSRSSSATSAASAPSPSRACRSARTTGSSSRPSRRSSARQRLSLPPI